MHLGIDPGLTGALALYDPVQNAVLDAFNIPTLEITRNGKAKKAIEIHQLYEKTVQLTTPFPSVHAVLELVGAMPGQGVSSMFQFGRVAGILEAILVCMRLPYSKVPPAVWKRNLGCGKDKQATVLRANELMPKSVAFWTPVRGERTKEQCNGIAEAALLAYHGAKIF